MAELVNYTIIPELRLILEFIKGNAIADNIVKNIKSKHFKIIN